MIFGAYIDDDDDDGDDDIKHTIITQCTVLLCSQRLALSLFARRKPKNPKVRAKGRSQLPEPEILQGFPGLTGTQQFPYVL